RIRHDELIDLLGRNALDADECDAGGECAAYAGELLVNDVRDPVRGRSQRTLGRAELLSRDALAGQHIEQLELDRVALASCSTLRDQLADGDEVALQVTPVLKTNL